MCTCVDSVTYFDFFSGGGCACECEAERGLHYVVITRWFWRTCLNVGLWQESRTTSHLRGAVQNISPSHASDLLQKSANLMEVEMTSSWNTCLSLSRIPQGRTEDMIAHRRRKQGNEQANKIERNALCRMIPDSSNCIGTNTFDFHPPRKIRTNGKTHRAAPCSNMQPNRYAKP